MLAWVCLWWGARPATSTRSIPRQADSSHCRLESAPVPNSWPRRSSMSPTHHLRGKPRWQFGHVRCSRGGRHSQSRCTGDRPNRPRRLRRHKLKIYQPAFSNDYYNDPSTGIVSVCGTAQPIPPHGSTYSDLAPHHEHTLFVLTTAPHFHRRPMFRLDRVL